jgi:hypothetical protein
LPESENSNWLPLKNSPIFCLNLIVFNIFTN